jgi:methylphosphotriester-DNA--protein-cysteine methyltransferase
MNYQHPAIEELASTAVFLNPFPIETAKPSEQVDWRVRKIKEFIDNRNGVTGSDFDEICGQLNLHISGTYAAQVFKESIGIGWREYAARYRVATAAERLKTTSNSVKEIAAELGYRRPQDLARGFKKAYRMSPTDYRHLYHLLEVMLPIEEQSPIAVRSSPTRDQ